MTKEMFSTDGQLEGWTVQHKTGPVEFMTLASRRPLDPVLARYAAPLAQAGYGTHQGKDRSR